MRNGFSSWRRITRFTLIPVSHDHHASSLPEEADRLEANELEIAILNLFVDIKIRYRNLVVGKLDRQHVKAAMEKGISAYQVSDSGRSTRAL